MLDLSGLGSFWNGNPSASEAADMMDKMEHEIQRLRAELKIARESIAYAVGPTRDVKEPMLRTALKSIDRSGLLDLEAKCST